MKTRYLKVKDGKKLNIDNYPSFSASGNIKGMKKLYYGQNCLLIKCGSYIYNVTSSPEIYYKAK